jgi:hypothetical protein
VAFFFVDIFWRNPTNDSLLGRRVFFVPIGPGLFGFGGEKFLYGVASDLQKILEGILL